MAYSGFCLCPCHSVMLGNVNALLHRGNVVKAATLVERPDFDTPLWTNVHDVLEAAVATGCSCLPNHAPALSTAPKKKPRPPYLPPKPFDPTEDNE